MDPYGDAYDDEPPRLPTRDEVMGLFWRGLYFVVVVTTVVVLGAELNRHFENL